MSTLRPYGARVSSFIAIYKQGVPTGLLYLGGFARLLLTHTKR